MVETGQWTSIQGRFGLDQNKASCLFSYASQQATYAPYQAYGNMLTDGIRQSVMNLHDYFPVNLAARTMAYRLYYNIASNAANGTAICESMVSMAVLNNSRCSDICAGQNFTNYEILQTWIEPVWFNNYAAIMV